MHVLNFKHIYHWFLKKKQKTNLWFEYLTGYQTVHLRLFCHQEEDSAFQVLASLSGTENKENVHHVLTSQRRKKQAKQNDNKTLSIKKNHIKLVNGLYL